MSPVWVGTSPLVTVKDFLMTLMGERSRTRSKEEAAQIQACVLAGCMEPDPGQRWSHLDATPPCSASLEAPEEYGSGPRPSSSLSPGVCLDPSAPVVQEKKKKVKFLIV